LWKKLLIVGILILLAIGVMGMTKDYPEWTLPISITAQEIENLRFDLASQSIDHLDIWITGQAQSVNVEVQGTASISIDNATITVDVATVKERASETGNVHTVSTIITVSAGGTNYDTLLEDATAEPVYLEMITAAVADSNIAGIDTLAKIFLEITVRDDDGTPLATIYVHLLNMPLNFDPALKVPAGGDVLVRVFNKDTVDHTVPVSVVFRY